MAKFNFNIRLFFAILFFASTALSAQTLKLQSIPTDKLQVGFSFEKPFYASTLTTSGLNGNYQLTMNLPLTEKINLVWDIPFINNSYEIDYGFGKYSYHKSGIGNIFIGTQMKTGSAFDTKSVFTFGLFLPSANEETALFGMLVDYYDIQKYIPNSFGIYFNYAYHKIKDEGFSYGLELGPDLLIPTKGEYSEDEFLIHYGIITGYQIQKLELNIEFIGFMMISEHVENFGDRFMNMLDFGVQWKAAYVIPKIFYMIYLKQDMRNMVDGTLGIGVTVPIKIK